MSTIGSAVAEFKSARDNFTKVIQGHLNKGFLEFFTAFPEFRTIEWFQYTPGFNDGDPCTFRVGDFYYTLQPSFYPEDEREMIEDNDYEVGDLEEYDPLKVPSAWDREYAAKYRVQSFLNDIAAYDALDDATKAERQRLYNAYQAFITELGKIPDEILLATFKDNMSIRATKDGFVTTEYDCGH